MSSVAKVGTPVQFHSSGTVGNDPYAAVVTACNEEGVADLVLFPKFGGTLIGKLGVRNATDPWHKEHPDVSRQTGCWDFIPSDDVESAPKQLPEPKGRK